MKKDLFYTQFQLKYQGSDRYQNLFEQKMLAALYRSDPAGFSPQAAQKQILELRALVAKARTSEADQFAAHPLGLSDTADSILDVLKAVPGGSEAGKFSLEFIDAAAKAAKTFGKENLQQGADSSTYLSLNDQANQYAQTAQQGQDIVFDSLSLSSDPKFAAAFNGLYAPTMDCTTGCSPDQLIASSPVLRGLDATTWMIDKATGTIRKDIETAAGGIKLDIDQLRQTEAQQFGDLQNSMDAARGDIQDLTAAQFEGNATLHDFVTRYESDQAYRAAQEADAAAKQAAAQERATDLAGAQGAVYLLSKLTGAIDPQFGNDVFTVGNSLIQIADNTNKLVGIISSAAEATVNPLALVSLAANIVSAVLPIADLFGPAAPNPNQVILQQIQQVQKEVGALRDEMNTRFDRVDQALNTIFDSLVSNFDKINVQLGTIEGGVLNLQTAMWNLQLSVDALEAHMHQVSEDQSRRELWAKIDEGLNWEHIQRGTQMPAAKFVEFNAYFFTYATTDAYDAVALPPFHPPESFAAVLAELRKFPLEENINYLGAAASSLLGVDVFNSVKLPNPRDWALGARAYEQLAYDWPLLARRSDPSRFDAVAAPGRTLDLALGRISRAPILFTRLIAEYKTRMDTLQSALDNEEKDFLSTLGVSPSVVFGSADQTLPPSAQISLASVPPCGAGPALANTPSDLSVKLIPNVFSVARALHVANLRVCYSAKWLNEATDAEGTTTANISLVIHAQYQEGSAGSAWQDFRSMEAVSSPETECFDRPDPLGKTGSVRSCRSALAAASSWWQSEELRVFTQQAATTDGPISAAAVTIKVQAAQASFADKLDKDVEARLGRDQDPLQVDARNVGGLKAMLSGFVQLGYPGTAASDEFVLSALNGPFPLDDDQTILDSVRIADASLHFDGSTPVGADVLSNRQATDAKLADATLARLARFDTAPASVADHQPLIIRTLRRLQSASTLTYGSFGQRPRLSNLTVAPRRLRQTGPGASIYYTDTQAGRSSLVIFRERPRLSPIRIATIILRDHRGRNRYPLNSILSKQVLRPGRYEIKLSALDAAGAHGSQLTATLDVLAK